MEVFHNRFKKIVHLEFDHTDTVLWENISNSWHVNCEPLTIDYTEQHAVNFITLLSVAFCEFD